MDWSQELDEREKKEVRLAEHYKATFDHGTSGHLSYSVIDKLRSLLEKYTGFDVNGRQIKDGKKP